jgi:hypothetical protein
MRWIAVLVFTSSCSLAFQDSVSSRSVYCSDSRFWYISDLVIGGAATYVLATRAEAPPAAFLPGALFLGSGAYGIYKRHNCVKWKETAPASEWERMASIAAAERQAAAEQAARDEAARQEAMRVAEEQAAAAAQQQLEQAAQQQVEQVVDQGVQVAQPGPQAPAPGQPAPAQPPRTAPSRPAQVPIHVEQRTVPKSNMSARSHAQCDGYLPIPGPNPKDPFGNAQAMARANRNPCYACVDGGKTFWIFALPPSYQYQCE